MFTHLLLLQPCNLCPAVRVAGTDGAKERGLFLSFLVENMRKLQTWHSILMGPFQLSTIYEMLQQQEALP